MKHTDTNLKEIKCFLMDMDGTLYLGERLLPGAKDWLGLLDDLGIAYYFLTNNSARSEVEYSDKFKRLGLQVPAEKIVTSGEATAIYLEKFYPDSSLFVLGTSELQDAFARHGFVLNEADPDVAILGFDTTLTYDRLWRFCDLVVAGKPYIATHPDINCPTEKGFKPDIGAMIELIAASTQKRPDVIIGKPYAPIVDAITMKSGFPIDAHCMIGDRLYTDIALGQWGLVTALVLSGETKRSDLADSVFVPDIVIRDIAEMAELIRKAYSLGN